MLIYMYIYAMILVKEVIFFLSKFPCISTLGSFKVAINHTIIYFINLFIKLFLCEFLINSQNNERING
jgi:hypothetical protein